MFKKLSLSLMITFLLLGIFSPVYAYSKDTYDQTRAVMCTICGEGTVSSRTTYGNLIETGNEVKCTHGKTYGTDKVYQQRVIVRYTCSYCGELGSNTSYRYVYECHGYY